MRWVGTSRRRGLTFLNAALATPKLSAVMSLLFVSLSIPILRFILVYNYHRTSAAILATLHEQVAKARVAAIDSAQHLIQPVASTLRRLAEVAAADPAVFKTAQSRELLYGALTSAEQIDAISVSFEDGYHRVVPRMDDNRRRSDPRIPQSANWHSSYLDDFSAGPNRRRQGGQRARSPVDGAPPRRRSALELPSPVSDLVVLASAMEVRLRLLRGKQIGADTHPATLVKLGAAGAELDTDCPLELFDAVQVILPPQTGLLAALDSQVMTVTEGTAGPRTAFVRFGGLDWDARARLEVLSRTGAPGA